MPQLKFCPDVAQFKLLAAGELSSADKESLLQHLEGCDACAQRLDTLPGQETLLELLRQGKSHGQGPVQQDVTRLVERLSKLKPTANPAGIVFRCECGKNLKVNADAAGKKVKCPHCQKVSVVTAPQAALAAQSQTVPMAHPAPALPPADINATVAFHGTTDPSTQGTKDWSRPEGDTVAPQEGHDPELTECLAPPQAADELGRLGPYRVLKILGAGGMGVVYKAEDPQLKRLVALKAMLPGLGASSSAKKRFLREAQAAAAIKHDHIVSIYQVGEERGVPFLAMEFLLGEPLDERLKREKKLPTPEVLRIGAEIAEGLAAAHEAGLIHRDIKPANVWLEGKKARVKILDFGLARPTAEQQHLTQSGAILGTPAYMAPEQAQGKPVDQRCDLFSLGVVLYRLCTGQQPFLGTDTVSTLVAVSTQEPPSPVQLQVDVPAGLSDLIMKLLAKDTAQRFGTAEEVVQALATLRDHSTIPAAVPVAQLAAPARPIPDTVIFEPPTAVEPKTTIVPRTAKPAYLAAVVIAGVVAVSLCALIAGGVIVYRLFFQTPSGELVVEAEGDAKVAFEKGRVLIFEPGGKTPLYTLSLNEKIKKLPLGKYKLKVAGADGVELNTDEFEMTKKGWKVRVWSLPNAMAKKGPNEKDKPPIETKPPIAVMEFGVHDYAEIHDADEPRFDAWIAQMKKDGLRPSRLSVQTVKGAPRYTAVALKDDKNWPWESSRCDDDDTAHNDKFWKRKFEVITHALYRDKDKTREAFIWAQDASLSNDAIWIGDASSTEKRVLTAQKKKLRLLSRTAVFEDNTAEFAIVLDAADGVPWLEAANLSLQGCKEWVEQHKAEGWRPDHLYYYGVGAKRLFGAILIKDANKTDWDISWSLTSADYEKELLARKAQGFRPLTAIGHEDNTGAQRFSAIWIRYRAPGAIEASAPPAFKHKLGMEFALVPKGKAWLGGGEGKEGTIPVHFDQDFYLGVYEVTQEEWEKVMGFKHTFHFSRNGEGKDLIAKITDAELKRFPAENVSWNECQLFLKKLNELDPQPGWEYRLPTEKEWEYACRGGPGDKVLSAYDYYLQGPTNLLLPSQANFEHDKAFKRTRQVGSYPPNRLGLFDMHGNVSELTHNAQAEKDDAGNPKRNERGGGWTNFGNDCMASDHYAWSPADRFRDLGLRVARVPVPAVRSPATENGILDFTEIHDADEKRFDTWIAQLQKDGFYPASVGILVVKDEPRYTAIALKEEKKRVWEFARTDFAKDGGLPHIQELRNKNYSAAIQNVFTQGGKQRMAFVWHWNMPGVDIWTGDKPFISNKIAVAAPNKYRPIYRCANDEGRRIAYSVLLGPNDGVPLDDFIDLALDDCKAMIEKQKADGWRPKQLYTYGAGAKLLFGVTLVQDGTDWAASWSLTAADYESALAVRRKDGFRPQVACAYDDNGTTRFNVVWTRYRAAATDK